MLVDPSVQPWLEEQKDRRALHPVAYEHLCVQEMRRALAAGDLDLPGGPAAHGITATVRLEGHYPDARVVVDLREDISGVEATLRFSIWAGREGRSDYADPPRWLVCMWLGAPSPVVVELRGCGARLPSLDALDTSLLKGIREERHRRENSTESGSS